MNTQRERDASPVAALKKVLAGAWRERPPALDFSAEELARATPLLKGSGAGPLGWWKVRRSALAYAPPAHSLREAYRYQVLQAAVQERAVEQVFQILNGAGVEALLVKGWAVARLYPEAGLRPSGDIDIYVRPRQRRLAEGALANSTGTALWVDLHEGFRESETRCFEELYKRGESLTLGATHVRVLCAEDHLRLLCLHMLRHGAWRPLWLCDVAAALETRPPQFDWERLLGQDRKRTRWVACAVGLAQMLLGARVAGTPFETAAQALPRWLMPEVLKQWETPYPTSQVPMRHRAPMVNYVRRPRGIVRDLMNRWPNPIEATIRLGGPLNGLPRVPFQLGYAATRAVKFLVRLPKAHDAQV